jgi:hypothetical protein
LPFRSPGAPPRFPHAGDRRFHQRVAVGSPTREFMAVAPLLYRLVQGAEPTDVRGDLGRGSVSCQVVTVPGESRSPRQRFNSRPPNKFRLWLRGARPITRSVAAPRSPTAAWLLRGFDRWSVGVIRNPWVQTGPPGGHCPAIGFVLVAEPPCQRGFFIPMHKRRRRHPYRGRVDQ